jgi:hypothetical protein
MVVGVQRYDTELHTRNRADAKKSRPPVSGFMLTVQYWFVCQLGTLEGAWSEIQTLPPQQRKDSSQCRKNKEAGELMELFSMRLLFLQKSTLFGRETRDFDQDPGLQVRR